MIETFDALATEHDGTAMKTIGEHRFAHDWRYYEGHPWFLGTTSCGIGSG